MEIVKKALHHNLEKAQVNISIQVLCKFYKELTQLEVVAYLCQIMKLCVATSQVAP
jgi:hypothetical protein